MDLVPLEDSFQPIQRQVVAQLTHSDIGQQARPRQAFINRLRRFFGRRDVRVVTLAVALGTAVFMADVLKYLEAGRKIFQLLADFRPDPLPLLAAGRAGLVLQVVLDRNPFQVFWQLLPAVRVAALHAAGDEWLSCFLGDARLVQRERFHALAEEQ